MQKLKVMHDRIVKKEVSNEDYQYMWQVIKNSKFGEILGKYTAALTSYKEFLKPKAASGQLSSKKRVEGKSAEPTVKQRIENNSFKKRKTKSPNPK